MSLKTIISNLPTYWKLATLRCAIYAAIIAADTFMSGVEGYTALSDMTDLQKIKLVISILVAMLTVWLAFIDQTLTHFGKQNPPDTVEQTVKQTTVTTKTNV